MRVVFDGPHLRAVLHEADGPDLVVTFSNLDVARAGFAAPRPIQWLAKRGVSQLEVMTAANDWYLNADLDPLRAALAGLGPYGRVSGIGFSMGGYGALLLSRALRLDQAVLVSPQATPFAEDPPFDPRWSPFAGGCERASVLGPEDIRPGLRAFALYDPMLVSGHGASAPGQRFDRAQVRRLVEIAPSITPVALAFGGHPCTKPIHQSGHWGRFLAIATGPDLGPRRLARLYRKSRLGSALWRDRFSAALEARAGRGGQAETHGAGP